MDLEIFHARFQFRPWFNRVWPFGIFMGHTYWLRESRSQLRSIPTTLSTQVVASFREQLADEIFTNGRIRTSHRGNYCCQFFSFDSILFSLHLVKLLIPMILVPMNFFSNYNQAKIRSFRRNCCYQFSFSLYISWENIENLFLRWASRD